MSNSDKSERRVTTTFDLKDIAVVAIAAFTAAGPFFAYDTRISVTETKVDQIQQTDKETRELVKEVESDLKIHIEEDTHTMNQLSRDIETIDRAQPEPEDQPKRRRPAGHPGK